MARELQPPAMTNRLQGQRVTVMGLGTRAGGVGVARYLAEAGAIVTVTDMRSERELGDSLRALDGLPIRYVLGRHDDADFTLEGAEVVVRNPGVRRTSRYLQLARASGVRVEMEMSLFLRECSAPAIGITGTKGKTTTATLCAELLRGWAAATVLAGNMGLSAVAALARIGPETPVVLELSSWQLEALAEHRLAPQIAVLTNISPDHLDAYDGFDDYAATKRSIARHLGPSGFLVLNADDPNAFRAASETIACVVPFGSGDRESTGMWVEGRYLVWRRHGRVIRFAVPDRLPYLGRHQRLNAAAATAAALLYGAPAEAIRTGLDRFAGVPNRMEVVAEAGGITFINDSAATAPAAAIANLTGLDGRRIHLISGGHDKQTDLAPLAAAIAERAATVHLLAGTATPQLAAQLEALGRTCSAPHDSMRAAVEEAAQSAVHGDVVLLSPGVASFGLFRDEFDRGQRFRDAVSALTLRGAERR
jgi:UDP-N-acetylmuramoylalanine--D-glutamate ligase